MAESPEERAPDPRVFSEGHWKHGRFYGSWRLGKYVFPIDSEELNRLDIFQKFFLVARGDMPCCLPADPEGRPKILDLGTGTGIWAIHVADFHLPNAQIMAVDLNKIQPPLIPQNLTTAQFDIEESSWEPLTRDCDLVHMRLMLGSIRDDLWPQVYRNVYKHLAPGTGMIEQSEIDWTPRWDDGSEQPPNSALREWANHFKESMDRYDRSIKVGAHAAKRQMEAAGFTDFKEEVIKCYVNPWPNDRRSRDIGRWFNLGLSYGLEAMSLMPMIEKLNMPIAEIRELCERASDEARFVRYRAYMTLHVWTAKRPSDRT